MAHSALVLHGGPVGGSNTKRSVSRSTLKGWVGIVHTISHDLKGRYSDSPYPWTARARKGTIRDSDKWLAERYPDAPRY